MKKRYFLLSALISSMSASFSASADQIIMDDLIVSGAQCVGMDCVNNENFAADLLRLKENNLRIRFIDSDTLSEQDQGWEITANNSANGGASYFSLFNKTDAITEQLLSDGTLKVNQYQLDCSTTPPTIIDAPIPAGEPALDALTCETIEIKIEMSAFKLGTGGDNGTSLGYHSDYQADVVSVGTVDLLRQIKHIAAGLADSDLLIQQQLLSPANSLVLKLDELEAQVAMLEALVTVKEQAKANSSSSGGAMGWPVVLLALLIAWRRRG